MSSYNVLLCIDMNTRMSWTCFGNCPMTLEYHMYHRIPRSLSESICAHYGTVLLVTVPISSHPDTIDECAVCMSSKLRKTSRGHANTMTATECLQGLGIDFAFMVQKSADSKRFDSLVGHNGKTCYVLITDHFSGRLIGRAFAIKAPPVDWLNQWLANNAPACTGKYVRMDGGGERGRCREILDTFANFGYQNPAHWSRLLPPEWPRRTSPSDYR
jgi:hypothetical protein